MDHQNLDRDVDAFLKKEKEKVDAQQQAEDRMANQIQRQEQQAQKASADWEEVFGFLQQLQEKLNPQLGADRQIELRRLDGGAALSMDGNTCQIELQTPNPVEGPHLLVKFASHQPISFKHKIAGGDITWSKRTKASMSVLPAEFSNYALASSILRLLQSSDLARMESGR